MFYKKNTVLFTSHAILLLLLSSWYIDFIFVLLSTSFWMFILISPEISSSGISVKSLPQLQEYLIMFYFFNTSKFFDFHCNFSHGFLWLYNNFCNLSMSIFKINIMKKISSKINVHTQLSPHASKSFYPKFTVVVQ